MSYRWKEVVAVCESCGLEFEKYAVSLSTKCELCKAAIGMGLRPDKREKKEQ